MTLKKSALVIFTLFFVSIRVSFAADDPGGASSSGGGAVCAPERASILKLLKAIPTSLMSTGVTHSIGVLLGTDPFIFSFGTIPAEAMGCLSYIIGNAALNNIPGASGFVSAIGGENCPETDDAVCRALTNQYHLGGGVTLRNYDSKSFADSQIAGSLLGYAYLAENVLRYEPPPVNMAYFFNDYLAKIPVIGERAYAQQRGSFGDPLIDNVLGIWKIFRNIAYALMSLIMLWTGFAIITRRKISSQTVVTVQYAMPKMVIALVMIALSYPLGALIAKLAWTLFWNAPTIIHTISGGTIDQAMAAYERMGIGGTAIIVLAAQVLISGAGSMLVILGLLMIVFMILAIFAYVKALWIFIKMVMSVAMSPLQIAMYALPGNDDKLENWLKQMASWAVGIFGIHFVLQLTISFALVLIFQSIAPGGSGGSLVNIVQPVVYGSLLNVVLVPLLLLFGFATAIKVPNMVEEAIMGKPKR